MTRMIALGLLLLTACTDVQNLGEIDHPVFGEPRWAISLGGIKGDGASSVAMDPAGNVIAAGGFSATVDFGNGTVTSANGAAWISKRAASDGGALWTATFGTEATAQAYITDIGMDGEGNIIASGAYGGTMQVNGQVFSSGGLTTSEMAVLAKYDPDGRLLWIRELGDMGATNQRVITLDISHDGRIAIAGTYLGTIQFPNGTFPAPVISSYVALLDANGRTLWGAVGSKDTYISSVKLTSESDVVLTGNIAYRSTFAERELAPLAFYTQFAARLSATGEPLWVRVLGTAGAIRDAIGVVVNPAGGTFLVSSQRGDNASSNNDKATIDAVDPNGQPLWVRQPASGVQPFFTTVSPNGTIITGGSVSGVVRSNQAVFRSDFGLGPRDGHMFVVAHDAKGHILDHTSVLDGCSAGIRKAATSEAGGLALVGGQGPSGGTGDPLKPCLRHAGEYDAVIMLLDTK